MEVLAPVGGWGGRTTDVGRSGTTRGNQGTTVIETVGVKVPWSRSVTHFLVDFVSLVHTPHTPVTLRDPDHNLRPTWGPPGTTTT